MNATDKIQIGGSLPRIAKVEPLENWVVEVIWALESGKGSEPVIVDLAPSILTYKLYRPLRKDRALFESVRAINGGASLVWGDDEEIDMAATTVERLAEETMQPSDFAAFLERNDFTLDRAAAELGISRRLVAYYSSGRSVPRYIALACAYLDAKNSSNSRESQESTAEASRTRRQIPSPDVLDQIAMFLQDLGTSTWAPSDARKTSNNQQFDGDKRKIISLEERRTTYRQVGRR